MDRITVDRRATAPPAPKREARRAVGSAARLQADTPSGGVSAGEADLLREQVILPEGERSSAENERDSNRTRWRPPSAAGEEGAELPVASVDLSSCDTWRRSARSPKRTATRSLRRRSMRRWHPRSTARDKYVPSAASPAATEDSRRARCQRRPATSIRIFVQAALSRSAYESYLPGVSCRNGDHGNSGSDSDCTAWLRRRWSSGRPFVGRRYRFSYRAPSPDVRNAMPTYPLALVSVDVGATCPANQTSIVPSCESMPSTNASVPMCRVIFPAVDATSFSALRPR